MIIGSTRSSVYISLHSFSLTSKPLPLCILLCHLERRNLQIQFSCGNFCLLESTHKESQSEFWKLRKWFEVRFTAWLLVSQLSSGWYHLPSLCTWFLTWVWKLTNKPVLVKVTIAIMKHHYQSKSGLKWIHLTLVSLSLSIIWGGQDRNSKGAGIWRQELRQKPRRSVVYWLHPPALHYLLSYTNKHQQPRSGTTEGEQGYFHPSVNEKIFCRPLCSLILWGHFLSQGFLIRWLYLVCD